MSSSLAGFSGVVVAFAQRGVLSVADRYRFITLFSRAIATVVLAFAPIALHYAGVVPPALWRASSAIMLAFWTAGVWLVGMRRPDLPADEMPPSWMQRSVLSLATLNLMLMVANVVGWPKEPAAFPYLIGLLVWLVTTSLFFAGLVLFRPRSESSG